MFLEQQQQSKTAGFGGSLDTLGVRYHLTADADSTTINLNKAAKLQDFGYAIRGGLLKQHYSPLHPSYKKSTLCGQRVSYQTQSGKAALKYDYLCRQKWCPRCARIRAAELITTYVPILSQWRDLYLVTLTQRSVNPLDLKDKLTEMQQRFRNIIRTIHRRLGTSDVKAIKSIEVTYNTKEKTLHPHYHVLVETRAAAELIHNLWLERAKQDGDYAVEAAQNIRHASSPEHAAKELFKYLTKFIGKDSSGISFDGWLLDKIYVGTRRKHLIQTFGFTAPDVVSDDDDGEYVTVDDDGVPSTSSSSAVWVPAIHNYVIIATGELCTYHQRSRAFSKILETINKWKPSVPIEYAPH